MELTDKLISRAELYQAGELSREALQANEGTPLSDEQVVELITLVEVYQKAIRQKALKQSFAEIQSEVERGQQRTTIWRWTAGVAVAASLVLIMVFSGLFSSSPDFQEMFQPYPYLNNLRNTDQPAIQEAMNFYVEEDYQRAFQALENLPAVTKSPESAFFKGVSALAINDWKAALEIFENLGTTTNNPFYQQCRWYWALAAWQAGNTDKAVTLLKEIEPTQYNHKEASELLNYLLKD